MDVAAVAIGAINVMRKTKQGVYAKGRNPAMAQVFKKNYGAQPVTGQGVRFLGNVGTVKQEGVQCRHSRLRHTFKQDRFGTLMRSYCDDSTCGEFQQLAYYEGRTEKEMRKNLGLL